MKGSFLQSMAWLHSWAGLLFGWVLFAVFFTGTLAVMDREINHWMRPEFHAVKSASEVQGLRAATDLFAREAKGAALWFVALPNDREPVMRVSWSGGVRGQTRYVDPGSDEILSPRQTVGGTFFFRFHYGLQMGTFGIWVVGAATIVLLAMLVSGVVIHRRFFADFFTFRPWSSAQRAWMDGHTAVGVLLLPFIAMIAYSGLAIFAHIYMPAAVQALYDGNRAAFSREIAPRTMPPAAGRPAQMLPLEELVAIAERRFGEGKVRFVSIRNPGDARATVDLVRTFEDRLSLSGDSMLLDGVSGETIDLRETHRASYLTQRVLAGLHFAKFGGWIVVWLYFICGMAGTAMIAAGLVLFTVKRRAKVASGEFPAWALRAIEIVNVSAVAGLLIASAAFLWGNRLLPVDVIGRAEAEIAVFFYVWLATLIASALRPHRRAWIEQLSLAAGLWTLVPVVNGLTGDGLALSLARGDWLTAGVDLTSLVGGLLLGATAWIVARKRADAHAEDETP